MGQNPQEQSIMPKLSKPMVAITCVAFAIITVLSLFLTCLLHDFEAKETILSRKTDSRKRWEAVLIKREAGATVGFSYAVRVRRNGSDEQGYEVLLIDRVDDPSRLTISWQGETLLITLPAVYQGFSQLLSAVVGETVLDVRYTFSHETAPENSRLDTR